MSTPFYDLASLVVVPSGYKASKVYAQKPLTTDGQLAFSRASTATRVNASGLIEEVASGVPRLDYTNSTCPKLLLEPQRSNVLTYSEQLDGPDWAESDATISANTAVSPDGNTNADSLVDDSINTRHIVYQGFNGNFATQRTFSVFAKKNTLRYLAMTVTVAGDTDCYSAIFDLQTGTVSATKINGNATLSASIVNYSNGWYRCAISGTMTTGTGDYYPIIASSDRPGFTGSLFGNNLPNYIGSGQSLYLYGAQLEAGAYATSYIPTTSAAVTRLADACSKTGISSLTSASEYTIYWEGTHIPTGEYNSFATFYNNANNNDSARFYRNNTDNQIRAAFFNSATGLALDLASGVTTQTAKCAIRVKAGSYAFYVNGALVNSSTSALAPASNLDAVNLQFLSSSQSYDQKTAQVLFFKTGLTNAQLAELTTL
jgi:hypothetical protein